MQKQELEKLQKSVENNQLIRSGFDDIATNLFKDKKVQIAVLEAMLKKGLGKRLMEIGNK